MRLYYTSQIDRNLQILKQPSNQVTDSKISELSSMQPLSSINLYANEFNNYFVNIGRLLSEQITSPHTSKEYLSDRPNVSFEFSPVSEDRIGYIKTRLLDQKLYLFCQKVAKVEHTIGDCN